MSSANARLEAIPTMLLEVPRCTAVNLRVPF